MELKKVAKEKGLLLMGPDCGTSIINHKVLGFGNAIREGTIGLVSASGTGLQEVATLIHKAGLGISQAIGTGGGDLSEEVGGITMIQGIELLEADKQTKVIVLISKPPAPGTMEKVLEVARRCRKPVVVNFLGAGVSPRMLGKLRSADTLEDAARVACELAGVKPQGATGIIPEGDDLRRPGRTQETRQEPTIHSRPLLGRNALLRVAERSSAVLRQGVLERPHQARGQGIQATLPARSMPA